MKRAIALGVALTFVAGCSGGGINGGSLVPATSPNARSVPGGFIDDGRHGALDVNVTMRIPKRHRRERVALHPATISPDTRSVSFVINGGARQIFNTTTSSSNCKVTASGTLCTFSVKAPPGSDSFIVTTYNAAGGGGTALDRAVATIVIAAGRANAPAIHLGPVVSIAADSGAGSLRYAIGTANSGDTILFTIPATSRITLASSLTLSANVSIAGPGTTRTASPHRDARHPDLHPNVGVTGLQISGAGTQQIFVVSAGVNASISGLVLTDGLATTTNRPGGAIYNAGNLKLTNDGFSSNGSQVSTSFIRVHPHTARHPGRHEPHHLRPHICPVNTQYGGAIYNHGNITVTGSTFVSNVLQNGFGCAYSHGGAIYTDEYSTLTSVGNVYSANSAYYGGAVYVNATYGQATFTSDQFISNAGCGTSTGCPSAGCSTLTALCTTSYPIGYGGAIYDEGGPGITVTSSTFTDNVAGGTTASSFGEGGALNLQAGSPVITGSTFTGNKAGGGTANCSQGSGGAIYEDAGTAIELDNDTFTSNVASGDKASYGGAVYNDANPDNGSNDKFSSNQALGTGSACTGSTYASGGALYAHYGIAMSNSSFTSNVAKANEDGYAGAIDAESTNSVLLTNDTFASNTAVATGLNGASDAEASGGALYLDLPTRINGDTFTGNNAVAQSAIGADAEGGAIYDGDTLISNGNTFTSDGASIPSATGSTNVYGGAVYAGSSSYYSNGDKFNSNKASGRTAAQGGALYTQGTFGITNDTFATNTVTASAGASSGGAAYFDSSGTVSGGSFTANKSTSTGYSSLTQHGGGAIYANSSVTISSITATGNSAAGGSGGAIFGDGSGVDINNSKITGNSTSGAGDSGGGGGIYNAYAMTIENTTVSGNSSAVSGTGSGGGGIYVYDSIAISGSTISGNKVTGSGADSGGGGIMNNDADTLTNDTISNNTSSINGGGFEEYGGYDVFLDNVTLYQNTATHDGGNVYDDASGPPYVALANTIVAGGTAASGKDVYNSTTITSGEYNILGSAQAGGGTFTPATGDKVTDPKLLVLSNNGGPTFTNADQATSPGKAYIPYTVATKTCGTIVDMGFDQRGYKRGAGNKCDVGAYEYLGTPYAVVVRSHAKLRPDPRKPGPRPHARHIPPHERG